MKNTKKQKSVKRRTSKRNIKKTYFLIALGIFSACAFLLFASFLLVPNISAAINKQTNIHSYEEPKLDAEQISASAEMQKTSSDKNADDTHALNNKKTQTENTEVQNKKPQLKNTETQNKKTQSVNNTTQPSRPHTAKTEQDVSHKTKSESDIKPSIAKVEPASHETSEIVKKAGTLFFVFDDAGHNISQLEKFLALPFPCTIAVLPGLPHSKEAAAKIRAVGFDAILHQPMQALNKNIDPGPQAILSGMSPEQAYEVVCSNIDELAPLAGMNNHEGSLITGDETLTRAFLQAVKEKQIFFLDSRTNPNTVVPKVARELNMNIFERNIFLDNSKAIADMRRQLERGLQYAREHGKAILIGHIFTPELAVLLSEMHAEIIQQGFEFKRLSDAEIKN